MNYGLICIKMETQFTLALCHRDATILSGAPIPPLQGSWRAAAASENFWRCVVPNRAVSGQTSLVILCEGATDALLAAHTKGWSKVYDAWHAKDFGTECPKSQAKMGLNAPAVTRSRTPLLCERLPPLAVLCSAPDPCGQPGCPYERPLGRVRGVHAAGVQPGPDRRRRGVHA